LKKKTNIILASSSPRRVELLNQIGLNPEEIINPVIDESKIHCSVITKTVIEVAFQKANIVKKKYNFKDKFIIAGDTLVYRAGKTYGKAKDLDSVKKNLNELSGKRHYVYGGICVISPNGKIAKKLVTTEVFMKRISLKELGTSDILNEGIDKAGGYAIQGFGSILVKKIKGSFSNVVGLSLFDVFNLLIGLGWEKSK
jgi:septum formation protein